MPILFEENYSKLQRLEKYSDEFLNLKKKLNKVFSVSYKTHILILSQPPSLFYSYDVWGRLAIVLSLFSYHLLPIIHNFNLFLFIFLFNFLLFSLPFPFFILIFLKLILNSISIKITYILLTASSLCKVFNRFASVKSFYLLKKALNRIFDTLSDCKNQAQLNLAFKAKRQVHICY